MTAVQRKRMRRRRRIVRNLKRTIYNIMVAPAKMPRITSQWIDQAMRYSEVAGMIFVISLTIQLANPNFLTKIGVILSAVAFLIFITTIKLGDYQDQLDELKYYGYNIY